MEEILDDIKEEEHIGSPPNYYTRKSFEFFVLSIFIYSLYALLFFLVPVTNKSPSAIYFLLIILISIASALATAGVFASFKSIFKKEQNTQRRRLLMLGNVMWFIFLLVRKVIPQVYLYLEKL